MECCLLESSVFKQIYPPKNCFPAHCVKTLTAQGPFPALRLKHPLQSLSSMWSEWDRIEGFFSPSDLLDLHLRCKETIGAIWKQTQTKPSCGQNIFYVLLDFPIHADKQRYHLGYMIIQTRQELDKIMPVCFFSIIIQPGITNSLLWDLKFLDHVSHWPMRRSKIKLMSQIFISQHIISFTGVWIKG